MKTNPESRLVSEKVTQLSIIFLFINQLINKNVINLKDLFPLDLLTMKRNLTP